MMNEIMFAEELEKLIDRAVIAGIDRDEIACELEFKSQAMRDELADDD